MSSTPHHTTVDIASLGFDVPGSNTAEVMIATAGDSTLIEVAHADDVWSLTFDEDGTLTDSPTRSPPDWLRRVITEAAPAFQIP